MKSSCSIVPLFALDRYYGSAISTPGFPYVLCELSRTAVSLIGNQISWEVIKPVMAISPITTVKMLALERYCAIEGTL